MDVLCSDCWTHLKADNPRFNAVPFNSDAKEQKFTLECDFRLIC